MSFDPGSSHIKAATDINLMKAEMGGAAVCSAIMSATKFSLLLNVIDLVLFVNVTQGIISPTSQEMSLEVIRAENRKTIQVGNIDAEQRILADILYHVHIFSIHQKCDLNRCHRHSFGEGHLSLEVLPVHSSGIPNYLRPTLKWRTTSGGCLCLKIA